MNNKTHDSDTSPESTATKPPEIGELRLCAWTGTAWHDYGVNLQVVAQALQWQHEAIDTLFAKVAARDKTFMPSEQPEFKAARMGNAVLNAIKQRPWE